MSVSDCTGYDNNNLVVFNLHASTTNSCDSKIITSADSPYSTLTTDVRILIDATAGPVVVQIVTDPLNPKQFYAFKRLDSTTNTITILPPVGNTIDSGASYNLPREKEVVTFCHRGTEWDVTNEKLDRVLTTKGDIFVNNGTKIIRLPVGTNTQVLTADSFVAAGIKWAPAGAGSSNYTYTLFDGNAVGTSTTLTPVGYFPWSAVQHGSYTTGSVTIRVTVSNRPITVRVIDVTNGPTTLGTLAAIAVTGTYTFAISMPVANAEVQLQIAKSAAGGINPVLRGAVVQFA